MSGIFVEYNLSPADAGYTDRPMRRHWPKRGYVDFLPKEEYGGRRVEEFSTEEEAIHFIGGQTKLYRIARDLISAEDQILIRNFLIKEIKPLADRVEELEALITAAPAPVPEEQVESTPEPESEAESEPPKKRGGRRGKKTTEE